MIALNLYFSFRFIDGLKQSEKSVKLLHIHPRIIHLFSITENILENMMDHLKRKRLID